jgi:hypothetical protein
MSETYGPSDGGAHGASKPVAVIDVPCGRKLNNALTMRFLRDGTGDPIATALQGGGDGVGKKLGILFGFKNGAAGTHVITYADGTTLSVPTVDSEPTQVTRGDGAAVCTITRGETTTITAPDGSVILRFLPDPDSPREPAFYRMRLEDGAATHLATMDVIRDAGGYGEVGILDVLDVVDTLASSGVGGLFSSDPGGSLKLPFFGCRTALFREPTPLEQDALLAACVEMGIGVRPYVAAMGSPGAAWT